MTDSKVKNIPQLANSPRPCFFNILKFVDNNDFFAIFEVFPDRIDLINWQARRVRYLIGFPANSYDYLHYQVEKLNNEIYSSIKFTNLKIVDITLAMNARVKLRNIKKLIKNQECLKGIIYYCRRYKEIITKHCNQLEMISSNGVEEYVKQNGSSLKQLHLRNYTLDGLINKFIIVETVNGKKKRASDQHYFPNLERLNIYSEKGINDREYYGPKFTNLKIFESKFFAPTNKLNIYYGFHFIINFCPNLQSAHIEVEADNLQNCSSKTPDHEHLQDLVINFRNKKRIDWNNIGQLLFKFKKLKHLALREYKNLLDYHIMDLVFNLPNLVLLDVRGCTGVTQRAADDVKDYCDLYEDPIKFYFDGNYHEIGTDWPQLSTEREKISRGFDFMKHCFRKDFIDLPHFLYPIDY